MREQIKRPQWKKETMKRNLEKYNIEMKVSLDRLNTKLNTGEYQ